MCWYCHWGWPKPVADIYIKAVCELEERDLGDYEPMHYGPGHTVWDDANFHLAQDCLDNFDEWDHGQFAPEALDIVRASLVALAALPDDAWDIAPEEYEWFGNMNPHDYPPTAEVVKCAYNVDEREKRNVCRTLD